MGATWATQISRHMQELTRNVSKDLTGNYFLVNMSRLHHLYLKVPLFCCSALFRNKLKEAAESIGLPTFVVADAGRTQVHINDN